ncbi:MAG: PepSY-associated TM helix domain-containing protein [Parashewanella sp.]
MKSKTIKKLYTLHTWVGIITGILLFVLAFTGSLSVFARPELKLWANPTTQEGKVFDAVKVESLVQKYAKEVPKQYLEEVTVFLPNVRNFNYLTVLYEDHHDEGQKTPEMGVVYEFDPNSYELISKKEGKVDQLFRSRKTDMADFIARFHGDLHLGRPLGLLLTGVLGLTLMLSVVTGFIIHRKKLAQLFTFRRTKSTSLLLNDGHKVLGIWGMLFHGMIGFTGAFLGLVIIILVPAAAFVSFNGDQDKLLEAVNATPEAQLSHQYAATPIATILTQERKNNPEANLTSITFDGLNDKTGLALISTFGGHNMAFQTSVYHAADAGFVERFSNLSKLEGHSGPIIDLMFPLHYGNFGGAFIKIVWAILGITTALLPVSGMMLWVKRGLNANNPRYSVSTYNRVNKLMLGTCGGVILACAALFPAQLVLSQISSIERLGYALGWVFFTTWLAATIAALIFTNIKSTLTGLTYLTATCLLSIIPLKIGLYQYYQIATLTSTNMTALVIDGFCLLFGIWMLMKLKKVSSSTSLDTEPSPTTA